MRLKIAGGKYALYYPQERPVTGRKIVVWDDGGNYLGLGFAVNHSCGVVLRVKGKTIDSNSTAHWAYVFDKCI